MNGNLNLGPHFLAENYGYLLEKAPQNVLNELKLQIDELQSNFNIGKRVNHELAGEIEHEYNLTPQLQLNQYLNNLTSQFEHYFSYIGSTASDPIPLALRTLWVNFQKKHEYNPMHNHSGLLSFVIWYQIPFLNENERNFSPKSSPEQITNGNFCFHVPHYFRKNTPILSYKLDVDKTTEGYIALFPSDLNHSVYPFYTSDDYRITVSGNIINTQIENR